MSSHRNWKQVLLHSLISAALAVAGVAGLCLVGGNVEGKKWEAAAEDFELIPDQNVDLATTQANLQKDTLYADFRSHFRFHYQTIGEAAFDDGSCLLLISEPPPYFNADTIAQIFSQFTHSVETKKHPVGYDGKITDLLVVLGNTTERNRTRLVKELSQAVYLSDYKPNVTSLPVEHGRSYFVEDTIDYQITLYEFNDWFMEKGEEFFPLSDTSNRVTVSQMFEEQLTGVFFSRVPGFVAWAIAKNRDLSEQLNHIRQFTLDADLVLGALADSATLVVIGRERQAALYELPPLNVESILLLASVTEKELSQSLDVNDFMAGKMKNGHDWCPTYLSKELENTEFGHLLTITDVLLKDWSENGTIQEAYYRYPSPPRFPFDRPLFKKLGLSELVYNWNTWNAMYAIDMDEGFTIYTLNRTGSLPVSYFNSQERSVSIGYRYENQAYNYFATLGNTDLARVVQYTALYQLFMDNGISYSGNVGEAFPKNKPYLLYTPTRNLMDFFKGLTDKQADWLADTISAINYSSYQKKQVTNALAKNEKNYQFKYSDQQRTEIYDRVAKDERNSLRAEIVSVRAMLSSLSDEDYTKLARYLAYPRGMRQSGSVAYQLVQRAQKLNRLVRRIGKNNLSVVGLDLSSVRNYYVGSLANASARYLKTPSVIVTYNDMLTTGGHNLSSGITRVNSLTGYKRGGGRGYYVPQQQTAPAGSKPASQPSSGSKPATSGSKTSASSTAKKSTTAAKPPQQNIRPRGEVISTAARSQRGF
jgi:hypothetical protein